MADNIDYYPRRIWTGLTVPGRKMLRIISGPYGPSVRDLHEDMEPHEVLRAVAYALYYVQKGRSLYITRTTLTDVRDVLKFRYRTDGMDSPLAPGAIA